MTAPLFSDLTVQFPSGWTGIVGPNGAGKTTLLKVATGELAAQAGTINRQGLALYVAQRTDDPPEFFDDFIWAPDASVLKARLRVSEDWPERWSTLSHGERKRAQIAVALWREPAVLALDEPSNHIDSDARRLLVQALTDFHGIGLLVSHDRALLDELCSQCLIIDPPDAVMRPGGVTEAMEEQEKEEQSARNANDALRRTENRLKDEAQRRRVIADVCAASGVPPKSTGSRNSRASGIWHSRLWVMIFVSGRTRGAKWPIMRPSMTPKGWLATNRTGPSGCTRAHAAWSMSIAISSSRMAAAKIFSPSGGFTAHSR
jgi:ATPase subunit of ABC transporter with duplicated ATPase domains